MHFYVLRAQPLAREPNAAHNLLYGGLVDEVVEPELVRILELELVVVCEEAEERKGLEDEVGRVGLVDELRALAGVPVGVGRGAYLHYGGEEVALDEVCQEGRLEGAGGKGQHHLDSLVPKLHCHL